MRYLYAIITSLLLSTAASAQSPFILKGLSVMDTYQQMNDGLFRGGRPIIEGGNDNDSAWWGFEECTTDDWDAELIGAPCPFMAPADTAPRLFGVAIESASVNTYETEEGLTERLVMIWMDEELDRNTTVAALSKRFGPVSLWRSSYGEDLYPVAEWHHEEDDVLYKLTFGKEMFHLTATYAGVSAYSDDF
jgi:hypothetical protein